jgi:hypothetical protein
MPERHRAKHGDERVPRSLECGQEPAKDLVLREKTGTTCASLPERRITSPTGGSSHLLTRKGNGGSVRAEPGERLLSLWRAHSGRQST